jgi:hypothetical protein
MDRQGFPLDEARGDEAEKSAAPRLCKCGRAPWRKGQRNCVLCNREANRKYRESLRTMTRALLRRGG